jgi:hypothetical protein
MIIAQRTKAVLALKPKVLIGCLAYTATYVVDTG